MITIKHIAQEKSFVVNMSRILTVNFSGDYFMAKFVQNQVSNNLSLLIAYTTSLRMKQNVLLQSSLQISIMRLQTFVDLSGFKAHLIKENWK